MRSAPSHIRDAATEPKSAQSPSGSEGRPGWQSERGGEQPISCPAPSKRLQGRALITRRWLGSTGPAINSAARSLFCHGSQLIRRRFGREAEFNKEGGPSRQLRTHQPWSEMRMAQMTQIE